MKWDFQKLQHEDSTRIVLSLFRFHVGNFHFDTSGVNKCYIIFSFDLNYNIYVKGKIRIRGLNKNRRFSRNGLHLRTHFMQ